MLVLSDDDQARLRLSHIDCIIPLHPPAHDLTDYWCVDEDLQSKLSLNVIVPSS